MNYKKYTPLFFLIALLLSCSKEESMISIFSVDITADSFTAEGGSKTVILSSNISWSAFSNETWLSVTPSSGKGGSTIILTTSENKTPNSRAAIVTLTPETGKPININTTQSTHYQFSINLSEILLAADQEIATVMLTSTIAWEATTNADWLTVSPENGTGNTELILTATYNENPEARSAIITLTPEIGNAVEITATQEAAIQLDKLTKFVAPEAVGKGTGDSESNAADFLNDFFWQQVNSQLNTKSVEIIFLPGDYRRAYTNPGTNGLNLDLIGNKNNRLTITGGSKVIFTVPEGYPTTSNLIRMHGCQNIHFRDFNFTGDGGINYVLAIRTPPGFPPSKNILIENCTWVDMRGVVYGTTGCHYEGTTDITYKNCTFKRIGVGAGSHMMYHAYGPKNIKINSCHFEDCMGDYIRFRDRTDFGIVKNSWFIRTITFPNVSFIAIPCYNNVDPGDEFFGTNYSFTDNYFINQAYENTGHAILFSHRGYSPHGYKYLPTAEEGRILTSGSRDEKLKQIEINFGIVLEKVRVVNNTYSQRITNQVSLYTSASYGSVSLGFQGTVVISDLINKSNVSFDWEDSW